VLVDFDHVLPPITDAAAIGFSRRGIRREEIILPGAITFGLIKVKNSLVPKICASAYGANFFFIFVPANTFDHSAMVQLDDNCEASLFALDGIWKSKVPRVSTVDLVSSLLFGEVTQGNAVLLLDGFTMLAMASPCRA
jgi:hypothetical protein